jgi:hypothetical protein
MEVISIEARTYEAMTKRFQATAQRVAALRKHCESKKLKEWLDSQDVCEILGVTKRSVQTLRETSALTMPDFKIVLIPASIVRT